VEPCGMLGPSGFERAQHRRTPRPSVERIRRKALKKSPALQGGATPRETFDASDPEAQGVAQVLQGGATAEEARAAMLQVLSAGVSRTWARLEAFEDADALLEKARDALA